MKLEDLIYIAMRELPSLYSIEINISNYGVDIELENSNFKTVYVELEGLDIKKDFSKCLLAAIEDVTNVDN